jgi:multicomponent K+:H+ antiporter subunit G
MSIYEILTVFFLIVGGFFLLVGSIGLSRLPDFYMRLHAPTKASTLGIGSILIASIIFYAFNGQGLLVKEFLITLFLFLTAPITAHMLSKAAIHVRLKPRADTLNTEYMEPIRNRQQHELNSKSTATPQTEE